MTTADTYLQPSAPDPVLPPGLVLRLVRRHVASAREVTAIDESGGEARAYFVDDGVVLKTQRPHRLRPRTSLSKEAFVLRQIASQPGLSVPRVLGYGVEETVEYLCLSRMPGLAVRALDLPPQARLRVAFELGLMLRRLHSLPQAPFAANQLVPGDRSPEAFRGRVASLLEAALPVLASGTGLWPLDRAPAVVAAAVTRLLDLAGPVVLLHSSPSPEHTFVDPASGALTGLIDFGDSYISHPALDLRVWPRHEEREAVLQGYGSESPLSPEFIEQWLATMAFADLTNLALRPDRRATAAANLPAVVRALGV